MQVGTLEHRLRGRNRRADFAGRPWTTPKRCVSQLSDPQRRVCGVLESGPIFALVGPTPVEIAQLWANPGRDLPKMRPTPIKLFLKSGPKCPTRGQLRPTSANLARSRPNVGRCRPMLGRVLPGLQPESNHSFPEVGKLRHWPGIGRDCPGISQHWRGIDQPRHSIDPSWRFDQTWLEARPNSGELDTRNPPYIYTCCPERAGVGPPGEAERG